jgi:hypothetical protein
MAMRSRLLGFVLAGGIVSIGLYYVKDTMKTDTERVADAVRTELSKEKGVKPTKVGFVQTNPNELHGFAMFKMGLREYVKSCVATRDGGNTPYQFSCY